MELLVYKNAQMEPLEILKLKNVQFVITHVKLVQDQNPTNVALVDPPFSY